MPNYKEMYLTLFNAVTDALAQLRVLDSFSAVQTLMNARVRAEEMYIERDGANKSRPALLPTEPPRGGDL